MQGKTWGYRASLLTMGVLREGELTVPWQLLSSLHIVCWSICCNLQLKLTQLEAHSSNHYLYFDPCHMPGTVQMQKNRQNCHKEIPQLTHRSRGITQVQSRRVEQHSRELRMTGSHRIPAWMRLEGTFGGQLLLPLLQQGLSNLPAVQLLVGILSLKDFSLCLKSEIQNAAPKIQNLPLGKPLLCCLFQAGKSC